MRDGIFLNIITVLLEIRLNFVDALWKQVTVFELKFISMNKTKIISVANHKGGVGKTTTVASVGVGLARRGFKVLLVDLDAQANLTSSLLEEEPPMTLYDTLIEGHELSIVHVMENVDIIPSSLTFHRQNWSCPPRWIGSTSSLNCLKR